jgi:hypothetical protein
MGTKSNSLMAAPSPLSSPLWDSTFHLRRIRGAAGAGVDPGTRVLDVFCGCGPDRRRCGALLLPQTARLAAALSGLMIFLWVVLLHIPRALAAVAAQSRNEWTAVFEALAISGIAFVLAGSLSNVRPRQVNSILERHI